VRIELYPKPDGMQHVNLMFCDAEPEPEDLWVREQLDGFPVPPKRILQREIDGRQYQVWQYGQCVVGEALFFIERYKGVVDRIRAVCGDDLARAGLPRERLNSLISETALELHREARFTVGALGELSITLDEARLRERMLERLDAESR